MTLQNERRDITLDLSREEEWLIHHVILDRIELERRTPEDSEPPSLAVYRVFEKLEAGVHRFSPRERECLQDELQQYVDANETPERDRAVTRRVLEQIR